MLSSPGSSSPLAVKVSQNGPGSLLVSWTPPESEEPAIIGYKIYCETQEHSMSAGATSTNASISGLIVGEEYFITVEAISNDLSSTKSTASNVTIQEGICYIQSHLLVSPNKQYLCIFSRFAGDSAVSYSNILYSR